MVVIMRNQDEIIAMAREAGFRPQSFFLESKLKAFYKLVAAKATQAEKERCAKIARIFYQPKYGSLSPIKSTESNPNHVALEIEAAILKVEQA